MIVITRVIPAYKLPEILNVSKDEVSQLIHDQEKIYREFFWLIKFQLGRQNNPKPTVSEGNSPTKYRIT